MPERWIGIVVSGSTVVVVDAEVPKSGPLVIQADSTWSLQSGDRASAYTVMHQQASDYIRENQIAKAVIKSSALSTGGTKKAHLEAAELRGVVMCAAASSTDTELLAKGHMSRTFGSRKVDEYVKDSKFWSAEVSGEKLRIGSREAALLLLAARGSS